MALEVVGGSALGVAFGELATSVLKVKHSNATFKATMEQLEATIESLHPVIEEMQDLNKRLNSDERDTERLMRLMEEGSKLVSKCCGIPRWNFIEKSRQQQKLARLENALLRFHSVQMQAHMARDLKRTLLALNNIGFTLNLAPYPKDITVDITMSSRIGNTSLHMQIGQMSEVLDEEGSHGLLSAANIRDLSQPLSAIARDEENWEVSMSPASVNPELIDKSFHNMQLHPHIRNYFIIKDNEDFMLRYDTLNKFSWLVCADSKFLINFPSLYKGTANTSFSVDILFKRKRRIIEEEETVSIQVSDQGIQ